MHFCADELFGLMMIIPFLGAFVHRMHAWYLKKFPKHGRICHDHREPREAVEVIDADEVNRKEDAIAISDAESEGPHHHHSDATFEELVRPEDLPWKFLNKKNEKE